MRHGPMGIARHGTGPRATAAAIVSQVHPVFMLPPVAAAWFGAILATEFSLLTGGIHSIAIFAAVYTAHVKDGYVDFFIRDEDDNHPLTANGCGVLLLAASIIFFCCLLVLWHLVDWIAVVLTLPGWIIGYFHAPQLDMRPIGATFGYPAGIALAILGGFYVQVMTIDAVVLAFALVFFLVLGGIKIVDDIQDVTYDQSIDKRTVAVLLSPIYAKRLAGCLMAGGLLFIVLMVILGYFPISTIVAVVLFAPLAWLGLRNDPTVGTALLIRSSYVFLAILVVSVWFRPLS